MNENKKLRLEREVYDEMKLTPEMVKSVHTLCPRCLNQFWQTEKFQIVRLPSVDGSKDTCTVCQTRRGFDYVVMPR